MSASTDPAMTPILEEILIHGHIVAELEDVTADPPAAPFAVPAARPARGRRASEWLAALRNALRNALRKALGPRVRALPTAAAPLLLAANGELLSGRATRWS